MTEESAQREDTMLYREPTPDSDDKAVQDIWGRKLETRVVDASEVHDLLADGWVRNPLDIGKSPEEKAGFERVERSEVVELRKEVEAAKERELALNDQLIAAKEEIARLKADLETATAPEPEKKTLTVPKKG